MKKADFQRYKKDKMFPKTIFREYFEEVSTMKWSEVDFTIFVENQSLFNRGYLANVINTILIPYYDQKFEIHKVTLLDSKGILIKELNEI